MRCLTLVVVDLAVLVLVARVARAWNDEEGSKPILHTTAEIMTRDAARERPRQIQDRAIKEDLDRSRLPVNPDSPMVSRFGGPAAASETGRPIGSLKAPQTVSTPNFTSVTTDSAPFVPPDTMGAVGPTSFLTAVNGRLRVHSKTTGAVGALDSEDRTFWASVSETPADPFLSYPRVRFDRFTDRWFLTILDIPSNVGANGSRILVAMSDGPDITASTSWRYFFFDQDLASPPGDAGCASFYPTLGIDVNALYIGANIYCGPTLSFFNTSAWVVRKSALLNPATPANLTLTPGAVTAFRELLGTPSAAGPLSPQGVDNDDPGAIRGRFIGVDRVNFGTLVLREVNNPGSGSPTISASMFLTVPTTTYPMDVPTPGGGRPLDGLDDRLLAAHQRAGRIWTAHQIQVNSGGVASDTGNRNGVRWYQIDISAGSPTLIQAGTVFDPGAVNPLSYWMGTVMVSGQGHAALGFTAASPTVRPAAATVGRLASGAPGTTQGPPVVYHAGEADYVDLVTSSGPLARWGNYSMTTLDPCDDMTMWTTQEFSTTPGPYEVNWGARVVRLLAPPPATPVSAVPPTVAIGQPSVSVTVTGSTAGGAAFYDTPAAGMSACRTRIAGLVGNGVTVNGITFVNPQTVTLDLNTMVATPGPAVVTVTNPDGQSAMGSVLTIPPATGAIVFGTKTVSGALSAGGAITYTVALTNSGLAQADNPGDEMSDILPSTLTLVSATATSGTAFADVGANTVHWNGAIPASGSVTITIQASVDAATPAGTIVSNQGTINYDADGNGTNESSVLTDDPGVPGSANPTVFVSGAALYPLTPCRGADTRGPVGTSGGPPLGANTTRTFPVTGLCGVPATATAVAFNVTVVGETDFGDLRLYPAGGSVPPSSTINFAVNKVRANNAIIPLGSGGQITVQCDMPPGSTGQTHFLFDVYGYFR